MPISSFMMLAQLYIQTCSALAAALVIVTSLSKLTAHLSGKCALHTTLKVLKIPIIPIYLMEMVI
jgi:hypothetical protein